MSRYLVACGRTTPARNLYLTEARWTAEDAPTGVIRLASCLTDPPEGEPGSYSLYQKFFDLLDADVDRYREILDLPRGEWISLPDPPTLSPLQEELLLGRIIMSSSIPTGSIADFRARGEDIEIVPKAPLFTRAWLSDWAGMLREVEESYRRERAEAVRLKDPYRILRD